MDKHFVVSTGNSTFTCNNVATIDSSVWEIQLYQHKGLKSGGVEGKVFLPGDWAPTRVLQYLEVLDKA